MTDAASTRLDRKITQAWLAMIWERLWAAFFWPALVLGAATTAVLSGVLPRLPDLLHYAALAVFLVAFVLSLRSLLRTVWPSRREAMRRLEIHSGLAHRPVSALSDQLSEDDETQRIIWEEHRRRELLRLTGLTPGLPRSAWRDLDRRALRVPVGLALVASLLLGPGDPRSNLADALRTAPLAAPEPVILDAWLKPPAYTGKPPLMLTSPAMIDRLRTESEILVPENATLTLRLTGAAAPRLSFSALTDDGQPGTAITDLKPVESTDGKTFTSEIKLTRPAAVRVFDGDGELAAWRIALIPDAAPTVSFNGVPRGDASGTLTVKWKTADDYGVTGLAAEIALSDTQDGELGIAGNGVFLFDPPAFPISLRKASPKAEEGATSAALAAHPWAGLSVDMVLTARDAAGHATASQIVTFKLPERLFTKPLARALIEQRRGLIMEPDDSPEVEKTLAALIAYPEGLIERSGDLLAIAAVMSRLRNAAGEDDIVAAIDMLWQTAVGIEDGELADAKAELDALRKELEKALAEGASPERIAELMDKMRKAMDRYMESLQRETAKRMERGEGGKDLGRQIQSISPGDLKKMLDAIERLAHSGARDAAEQLLSQLDNILRNLQPGMNPRQGDQQASGPMSQMLDQLSDLMRRQQRLMDETQRLPQGGDGELSEENGQEPGSRGQRNDPEALAGDQEELGRMLEDMIRKLGENGLQAPPSLGEAGRQMQGAEGSLRQLDREGALSQQGEALRQLRQGAQNMVQQLIQQGLGQQGNDGRHGEARGDDRDPLGRPMPSRGEDYGPQRDMLPSEMALRRAREILDMLRSRASQPELPRLEHDYIDRLLRGLY